MGSTVPPALLESGNGTSLIDRDVSRWYACHTRSRAEKRVARLLNERSIESWLPTVKRKSAWADRIRLVVFPLFPGYVFGRFPLSRLYRVLSTPGVAMVVGLAGRPAPIRDSEIENVRRFAAGLAGLDQQAEPEPLLEGQRVRVIGGPLEGVEGVAFVRRGRTSLQVGLRTIGQGIAIYIDPGLLQATPPADDGSMATLRS